MTFPIPSVALLFTLLLPPSLLTNAEDSAVITLTDSNFDALTAEGSWILDFYAPWCGHCKRLEPEYEKAAKEMKGSVSFGKVDCTKWTGLRSRFGVKGYPTLKFMRDGELRDYRGGRTQKDLVNYAKALSGEPVLPVTREMVDAITSRHAVSFVYVGTSKDEEEYANFERVAKRHQGVYFFGVANGEVGEQLLSEFGQKTDDNDASPCILYLTRGDTAQRFFQFDLEALEGFVKDHKFGLVTEINADTFGAVAENGLPVLLAVLSKQSDTASKEYKRFLTRYGLSQKHFPCFIVVDFENERYWAVPSGKRLDTIADIEAWMNDVAEGKQPYTPLVPWYNPRRYMRKVSKFMRRFSDTQIMIITIVGSLFGAGLLFMCFTYIEGNPDEVYARRREDAPPAQPAPAPTDKSKTE
eukprot:jgi/Bigna1/87273/estExt_fgenesh1_pg.C_180143